MAVEIPCQPSNGFYTVVTALPVAGTSTTFRFTFKWNVRDLSWYMHVADANSIPIASSRVVLGMYLCRRAIHPLFQNGVIVALDTTNTGTEATLDSLGAGVVLLYLTVDEVRFGRGTVTGQASGD